MSSTHSSPVLKKMMMNGTQTPVRSCIYTNHCSTVLTTIDSEVSDVGDDEALDESLFDRIAALKDIVPPVYRKNLSSVTSTGYSWASKALSLGGKTLWVVSTSALLLGVPWALAFGEEQQVQEMEREMQMQRNANEVSLLRVFDMAVWAERLTDSICVAPYAGWWGRSEACSVDARKRSWMSRCVIIAVLYTLLMTSADLRPTQISNQSVVVVKTARQLCVPQINTSGQHHSQSPIK